MTPKQNLRTLGWSNQQLADAIGVDETTIRRFFFNSRSRPDLTKWLAIAAAWVTEHPPPRGKKDIAT